MAGRLRRRRGAALVLWLAIMAAGCGKAPAGGQSKPGAPGPAGREQPVVGANRYGKCGSDKDCRGDLICVAGKCDVARDQVARVAESGNRVGMSVYGSANWGADEPSVLAAVFCRGGDKRCIEAIDALDVVVKREGAVRVVYWPVVNLDNDDDVIAARYRMALASVKRAVAFDQRLTTMFRDEKQRVGDFFRDVAEDVAKTANTGLSRLLTPDMTATVGDDVVLQGRMTKALSGVVAPRVFINGRELSVRSTTEDFASVIAGEFVRAEALKAAGVPVADVPRRLAESNNPAFAAAYFGVLDAARGRSSPATLAQASGGLEVALPLPRQRRNRPIPASLDWVKGSSRAAVTLVAHVDRRNPADGRVFYALTRLSRALPAEDLRVVLKPFVKDLESQSVREARMIATLRPEDRVALLDWSYVHGEQATPQAFEAEAIRLAGGRDELAKVGDGPEVEGYLVTLLRDQYRVGIKESPAVFLNGTRVDASRSEKDLEFLVRREMADVRALLAKEPAGRADPYRHVLRRYKSADLIGDEAVPFPIESLALSGVAEGRVPTVVFFLDFQCPYSRQMMLLLGTVAEAVKGGFRVAYANFPMESHPQARDMAAAVICADQQHAFMKAVRYLYGTAFERQAFDVGALCLDAPVNDCAELSRCMQSKVTQQRIDAEIKLGRAADVAGPPALFIDGRKITPQRQGFSTELVAEVLTGFFLRDWTLPAASRVNPPPEPPRAQEAPQEASPVPAAQEQAAQPQEEAR
jgi:hypothetical protein